MRKYTADFETTTEAQDCRVWAYSICSVDDPEEFSYGNNLNDFMKHVESNPGIYYFHNLKFDGSFILDWLLKHGFSWIKEKSKNQNPFTFTTLITDTGIFYSIEVKFKKTKVKFYDSLKILNFSVAQIAKDFDLPIRKLEIDYKLHRPEGWELTNEEIDYIRNDVEIMARAIKIMENYELNKMTIGSCALNDYRSRMSKKMFDLLFPKLPIEVDRDIRESYRGGWTYLNPIYQNQETGPGVVLDRNSMYPSVMVYEPLPYGLPVFFEGQYQFDNHCPLFIQSFSCIFDLKPGKLPTIQIKNSLSFILNEWLESSHGEIVTLNLCSPDFYLFMENYNVRHLTFHGGWKFQAMTGMFGDYIKYWTESKIKAKKDGNKALYLISKLMLNSLYGKMGTNPISCQKMPVLQDDMVKFVNQEPEEKDPLYIPVASFITSYARTTMIRTSQFIREYGLKKYGQDSFIYSDTDSCHCLLNPDDLKEISKFIKIDSYELGAWDMETTFGRGKYLRQKCYIEEIEGKVVAHVAGLPSKLAQFITFDNFRVGFTTNELDEKIRKANPKLRYKHVKGGVILEEVEYSIK